MRKTIKYLSMLLLGYLLLTLLTSHSKFLLDRSIGNQINHINTQLINGGDDKLQKRYPEGYIFSNSIFALSLIELHELRLQDSKSYAKNVDRCLRRLLSDQGTESFSKNLSLTHGAFYNGWTNYTLKTYVESELFSHSDHKEYFISEHARLSYLTIEYQKDSITLVETYTDAIWPADNLICLLSLPDDQIKLQEKWLQALIENSSNNLDLINHDNYDRSIARGSSQALSLYFLNDFDSGYAIAANEIFQNNYIDDILEIKLVREYVNDGEQDLDSGPVILNYGSVATIMNIKTQSKFGVKERSTWNLMNTLGIPINLFSKKYYLFQKELMFDIFMLWSSVSLL